MPEFGGLQIEARCVKCGRLSTAEIALFELQNHLYICNLCSQEDVKAGKQIALAGGNRLSRHNTNSAVASAETPVRASSRVSPPVNVPADSLFAVLELPLTASLAQIREKIKQQMGFWMKQRGNPQQKQMIARLREWQEDLLDEETFEQNRARLKELAHGDLVGLSVGGRAVFTLSEFLDACEEIKEGWLDGERLLRTGELAHWILFQLDSQPLAELAVYYQKQQAFSDFRALNEALYALLPERPFRFYSHEKWQARSEVPDATTAKELADLCDLDWETGLLHLYRGSLVFWLERSQNIPGLLDYYRWAVAPYERHPHNRGLGLELLLEQAIPDPALLPRPKLVVTLDGHVGSCTIPKWDRELPHQPIEVVVTNTTRGFTSLNLSLAHQPEPPWVQMYPDDISGQPGIGLPYTTQIQLYNLSLLKRGWTYTCKLNLSINGAYGTPPTTQQFPLRLKTMYGFQGLRGRLWLFGLRGNLPGLLWSAVPGFLLAFLWLQFFAGFLFPWYSSLEIARQPQWAVVSQTLSDFSFVCSFPGPYFAWFFALLTGMAGFWVGLGKGHDEEDIRQGYNARRGSKAFRNWLFWLLGPVAVLALAIWDRDLNYLFSGQPQATTVTSILLAYLLLWLLILLIASLIALFRSRLEKFVRQHFDSLLELSGRM